CAGYFVVVIAGGYGIVFSGRTEQRFTGTSIFLGENGYLIFCFGYASLRRPEYGKYVGYNGAYGAYLFVFNVDRGIAGFYGRGHKSYYVCRVFAQHYQHWQGPRPARDL